MGVNDPRLQLKGWGIFLGITPLCILLGLWTPWLIDTYGHPFSVRVGQMYAVNILGCILGPLVVSYATFAFCWREVVGDPIDFRLLYFLSGRSDRSGFFSRALPMGITLSLCFFYAFWGQSYEEAFPGGIIIRRDYVCHGGLHGKPGSANGSL